ncbi:hypothetical protein BS78_09G246200 [Paspalum vaginatum]|nr:hypothetical protein BS78_09G246200 [Paspalum vaginatum]
MGLVRLHHKLLRHRLPEPVQRRRRRRQPTTVATTAGSVRRGQRAVRLAGRRCALPQQSLLPPMGLLRLHGRLPEPVRRQPEPASVADDRRRHRRFHHLAVALRPDAAAPQRRRVPGAGLLHLQRLHRGGQRLPRLGHHGRSLDTRKREMVAFLGQTSHETTGGWPTAPDGPYSWGYCFKEENCGAACSAYCQPSSQWPCAAGKKYYGRGPILELQLRARGAGPGHRHRPAGHATRDLVASDAVVAFKTANWFWMTAQPPKPSSHAAVITNIVNGGLECGHGTDFRVADRIGFYKGYCDLFGVSYGDNLDCYNQTPFS